jgi:hypothetical protein
MIDASHCFDLDSQNCIVATRDYQREDLALLAMEEMQHTPGQRVHSVQCSQRVPCFD